MKRTYRVPYPVPALNNESFNAFGGTHKSPKNIRRSKSAGQGISTSACGRVEAREHTTEQTRRVKAREEGLTKLRHEDRLVPRFKRRSWLVLVRQELCSHLTGDDYLFAHQTVK